MNRNVKDAMEKIERANAFSKQPRFQPTNPQALYTSIYRWLKDNRDMEQPYSVDSRRRDSWLSKVWMKESHLAGAVGSITSIDRNRDWSLIGGRNVVNRYTTILREAEDGEGWRYFIGRAALAFYTSDIGAVTEIGRDGEEGPTRAFYNADSTKCYLTGKRETPLAYAPENGKEQVWKPLDYFRTTALPLILEEYRGLGFCAISRVWSFGQLLLAAYEHDLEELSAAAPKGLLLLQNIAEQQWIDSMKSREAVMHQKERDYYGGVAVIAQEGVDQIDAKLVALSQLPKGFDLEVFTKLMMLGIALGFQYDPIELWPVEAGALGRGRESEIQHMKATGKGGVEFVRTFQDRLQQELPPTLLFEFAQRDVSGELADAEVQKAWQEVFVGYYDKGVGVLNADEVRQLMVKRGIIPAEWTTAEEQAQSDSTGEQRSWLNQECVWRSIFENPRESIVRYSYHGNQTVTLARDGYSVIRDHYEHPTARAVYDSYPVPEFKELYSYRFFPVTKRDILYEDDDVEITDEDVKQALNKGKQRVGKEFGALLMAKEEV